VCLFTTLVAKARSKRLSGRVNSTWPDLWGVRRPSLNTVTVVLVLPDRSDGFFLMGNSGWLCDNRER